MNSLLTISNLTVKFPGRFGELTAIEDVSLTVNTGEIHGIVGESGAGKSTIGAAVIGLIQAPGYIQHGQIMLSDQNLTQLDSEAYHRIRGDRISMIFQDPQTSLNPLLTIADQLIETIRQHREISHEGARLEAIDLLEETGLTDVEHRIDDYPHQFSGGMRQRVVIALALCTNPDLIIADEPTTALDVSVQQQILRLLKHLARERGVGFILITHDIGVIAEVADRVTVLRHGRMIETGTTTELLGSPKKKYTQNLMAAVPRMDQRLHRFEVIDSEETIDDTQRIVVSASAEYASEWLKTPSQDLNTDSMEKKKPILSVNKLSVFFDTGSSRWWSPKQKQAAISDVSFEMKNGQVLGVVGESGSGKSTLAKTIVGLVNPTTGSMSYRGEILPPGNKRSRHHWSRQEIQMIFQDPFSSLNNRKTVKEIIAEPISFYKLSKSRKDTNKLIASMLELVEMPQSAMARFPHQFSGGQRQRIAIARALVAKPEFLVCDEPTSALDVSIQAQILNLLKDLQQTFGLSILFISHNLAVVRQMADEIIVLKNGALVEASATETFFSEPKHSYSKMLLSETPSLAILER